LVEGSVEGLVERRLGEEKLVERRLGEEKLVKEELLGAKEELVKGSKKEGQI
jgi:hypothetical protein